MRIINKIAGIFLLQIICVLAAAQNYKLKFNQVEGNNGKPLGKINCITQDPQGYMWFVSPGDKCLYRYDGNRLIPFRHDESNPNSLGMTNFEAVYADNAGMIWIGGDGLDQYNPLTGVFKHYRNIKGDTNSLADNGINAIIKDRQGRLWVGTGNGLDRLDEKTGKFIHYRNQAGNPKSLSSNVVWRLYEDRQGVLWIATGFPWFKRDPEDGGLNRLEPDGTFTRFMHDPNDPHSLINNKIAAMYEDSRGIFWVGTGGDGLHTMDRKTGRFERHLYNPKEPGQLSRPPLKQGDDNDKITFITGDNTGAIWIGSFSSGINRYDTNTKKITHYVNYNGFPDSTSWNVFTSRGGELWISTEGPSLFRFDPFHQSINSVSTAAHANNFLEDSEGYLWVSTQGDGLLKFDQHKNLISQFKDDPSNPIGLPTNDIGPLFQNDENIIWVGTFSGIRMFNKLTQQFYRVNDGGNLRDAHDSGFVKIIQDKQGVMWFTRWGLGLISYNPRDHSFTHFLPDPGDSTSISSDQLNSVLVDRSGVIWVSGNGGINRLNRETGRFKHYLAGSFGTYLYEDSEGSLWAGTNNGLYRYNQKSDQFLAFFDQLSEISNLSVGGIIEDNEKNLWLTSPSAIIKLNPVSGEAFIYGSKFGINPNTLAPWGHAFKSREGELFFGHDNGFYAFFPGQLNVKTDFKIIITDLSINNIPVLPGKTGTMHLPVEEISELDLRYSQNNIAFNFSAIDYREPEAIKYYSMLENYDNVWREVRGEKSSYYFNVPPGKYIYHLKAFNNDGTKAEKKITIYINPPWWKTWWAYAIYALLLLAVIFGIYRYQKQHIIQVERQKRQQFELAQAKEIEKAYTELKATQAQLIQSEKMASLGELTAGIAHEIQNPLNFVNNFSEVSNELIEEMTAELDKGNTKEAKTIAEDLKHNLEKINHHGKRADAIVKGMLQHSRVSTGVKETTDINALAEEYLRLAYHGLRAKDKSFNATLKTDFDPAIGNINVVSQDIGRVILNLINNAFYAVAEKKHQQPDGYGPMVTVSTKKIKDTVEIRVEDNGNGVPQKVLDKIFQPFFTTKPTGQGTGLGLSLSYDIIKTHGGELKVETTEGEGASFVILLPIKDKNK